MKKLPIGIRVRNLKELFENSPERFREVMREIKVLRYEEVDPAGFYW